jgi:hypothetical protein
MKQITDGYDLQFLISKTDVTHTLHQLALLASSNYCPDIFSSIVPEVPLTDLSQCSLFSKMLEIFMHLNHQWNPFLRFGHIQPFEIELLPLLAIIVCPLPSPFSFLKVHSIR